MRAVIHRTGAKRKSPNPQGVQGRNSLHRVGCSHHRNHERRCKSCATPGQRALRHLPSCRIEAFSPAFIIGITMRSRLGSICSSVKKLLLIGAIDESPPFRCRCRPRAYCCCRLYRHRRAGARKRYPKPQRDHRRYLGSYDDPVGRYARRRSDVPHRTTASLSSAPGVTEPAPPAHLQSPPRIGPGRDAVMGS
jgi:hypothetical protein